ncbi:hypothetical protein PTKIN_Ptkin09bG0224100 [Pterospermum kingtungense]
MGSLHFSSLIFSLILLTPLSSSTYQKLIKGTSLSVENPRDVLISPNGTFSAGFYLVGNNTYAFAIWFSKPNCLLCNCTVVWMANRDHPVNGRDSKLSLLGNGNLILTDAAQFNVWATSTTSLLAVQLQLNDYGNLVLRNSQDEVELSPLLGSHVFKAGHLPSFFQMYKKSDPDWEFVKDMKLDK